MAVSVTTSTPHDSADRRVPGPTWQTAPRYAVTLLRDPLGGLAALRSEYGDTVRIPFTPRRSFFLLSRPEQAEHVLVTHQDRYVKPFTYRPLRMFLGDGLVTSEGDTWRRHRRLVQPVFSRRHVAGFAPAMAAAAAERIAGWAARGSIDLAAELRTLTMDVVGRVLFGARLAAEAERVGKGVTRLQDAAVIGAFLPLGSSRRAKALATALMPGIGAAVKTLDDLVDSVVDQRIAHPHKTPTDLLDLLVSATGDAGPLTAPEIRDEVATLVFAGHETTLNALVWTFTLLSQHPAAGERLYAEVDEVLAGRAPEAGDVDKLAWTGAVISEAMRLYPPAWTIERAAAVNDVIGGVDIPARSTVVVSPYLLHRDPESWPNPEGFDPARFLPGHSDRPKLAYLPFGGGRRVCVGAGFAQLEATLVLATVASRYRLDLAPGAQVRPRAGITLHPDGPVPMTVHTRTHHASGR